MSVPQIRFKRDDGSDYPEWRETQLGNISEYGKTSVTVPKSRFVSTENMLQHCLGIVPYKDDTPVKGTPFKIGDTLVANIRPYLKKAWVATFDGACSTDVLVFKTDKVDKLWLGTMLKSDNFFAYTMTGAKGVKMPRGDKQHIMEMNMLVPESVDEQTKIATFLSQVDDVISVSEEEVAKLEQLKKGMMQKIFSQEVRFKKDDGSDYEDWGQVALKSISERVRRKNNKNGETISDIPLTISSIQGLVDQREYFNKTVAATNMSNYFLLKKGEFAYNKSYSKGYDYGSIKRLDRYDEGALSTLYICFSLSDDVDSDFMTCYFDSQSWTGEASLVCAEGARNHGLLNISPDDFFGMNLMLPRDKEEQTKIAVFFSSMDDAITAAREELDKYKELKKGLLQQMFI